MQLIFSCLESAAERYKDTLGVRVTVSLNKETTVEAANTGKVLDLSKLVSSRSKSEVIRVFGRGRFVSIETTPAELSRLKDELGHMCLFSLKSEVVPFG